MAGSDVEAGRPSSLPNLCGRVFRMAASEAQVQFGAAGRSRGGFAVLVLRTAQAAAAWSCRSCAPRVPRIGAHNTRLLVGADRPAAGNSRFGTC
jgi:hypothetical protein